MKINLLALIKLKVSSCYIHVSKYQVAMVVDFGHGLKLTC